MARPQGLSKSRFTAGLQCHKQLWWRVHEPTAPELMPDEAQQAIFDQGTQVGEVARAHVPGGVLIDRHYSDYEGRLADTQRAIAAGAQVIYEASFSANSTFVAVDILERVASGWRLIEVKSSTMVKAEYLPDAAIQVHVLRTAGTPVSGAEVMVLNRACTYPDLSDLFLRHDVTPSVEDILPAIPAQVHAQLAMLDGPLPDVTMGPHCDQPWPCPFRLRCGPPLPEHHVSTLYYIRNRAPALEAQGYRTIHELPEGLGLNPKAERQRRAVQAGRILVEGPLAETLDRFAGPLAFLDFETVQFAIPIWDGCHPYDQIPAQFSCHVEREDGTLEHFEWVPEAPGDPRAEIARRIVDACAGAHTVVAYNAPFEKTCLLSLARALPAQAAALEDVVARLADLLPVVREHVYHPDFGGSFGLKSVLPALVPDLGYDSLEIAEGQRASRELQRILEDRPEMTVADRARVREALLRYCGMDTLAMVRLMGRLRVLARGA